MFGVGGTLTFFKLYLGVIWIWVEEVKPHGLGVGAGEVELVLPARRHQGVERRDAFLAGVSQAPPLVLGSVDQVHPLLGVERHRGESAHFGVGVHALYDHHDVVEVVAFVCLPVFQPVTVAATFSNNACT